MEPLFEIGVKWKVKGSRESSQSLYRQLKEAIADGRLKAGTQLPATRRSATFFGVSRNTAVAVYERLLNEGYVVTRGGSGTYVADGRVAPAARSPSAKAGAIRRPRGPSRGANGSPDQVTHEGSRLPAPSQMLNDFWLRPEVTAAMSFWRDDAPETSPVVARAEGASANPDRVPVAPRRASNAPVVDFRPALVDSRLFPLDVFRRVSAKRLRGLERKPASFKSPQGNQGNYHLRTAITRHIALTRAVVCEPEDVLVTSGAQQAFDLLARTLVTRDVTVVAVEDPGYPPMRVAFAAAGAKVVPIPVDREGLIVDRLPRDARVICVCPSHQFPLGVTMSTARRTALIEFARNVGAVIVEDDYDGEFRYEGSPLEALRTHDAADVVFYVGTFSKCMLPSLRLGFLIAPDWALQTLIAAKNCLDWHCPIPIQLGVAEFIAAGHLARHVRKMRTLYRQRRDLLLSSLQTHLQDWLVAIPSCYGMHIAATTRQPFDLERTTESLLAQNVKMHSFRRYFLGTPTHEGVVLGFGALEVQGIERGIALLRRSLAQLRASRSKLAP
jgi:GntR family transcriptional regulator/MocR family aminotransferase